jgi:broad specificity phosphatase PhoE
VFDFADMIRKRILLVRHGETDSNRTLRLQGKLPVPLNKVGEQEALHAAQYLERVMRATPRTNIRLVSSSAVRAVQTATAIAKELDVVIWDRLDVFQERGLGDWEGRLLVDAMKTVDYNALPEPKFAHLVEHLCTTTGEGRDVYLNRMIAACETLLRLVSDDSVAVLVVVSHGLTMRCIVALMCFFNRKPEAFSWPLFDVGNASVTEIAVRNGVPHLVSLNVTTHLEKKDDRYALLANHATSKL